MNRKVEIEHRRRLAGLSPNGPIDAELWHKDGHRVHAELRESLIRNDDGRVIGIEGIARDVGESRRLTEQVYRTEKLAALGELVSGVAHELNNPLAIVSGYARLLLDRDVGAGVREELEHISSNAERCRKIVENLLRFASKGGERKEPASINDIIESALSLLDHQLSSQEIEVLRELDKDIPATHANYRQMEQVFLSVVGNAISAMSRMSARGKKRRLLVRSFERGDRIVVEFEDTGPGISPESVTRAFDPFFTTHDVGGGTGLGLSIAYGIVKDHQGDIDIDSSPGAGTRLVIELPGLEMPLQSEPRVERESRRNSGPKQILVVDDEDIMRNLLASILEGMDHSVDLAESAQSALEAIASGSYDVILCDLNMPSMSGREFYEAATHYDYRLGGKIVFLSGAVGEDDEEFLQRTGSRFLSKPFTQEKLVTVLA